MPSPAPAPATPAPAPMDLAAPAPAPMNIDAPVAEEGAEERAGESGDESSGCGTEYSEYSDDDDAVILVRRFPAPAGTYTRAVPRVLGMGVLPPDHVQSGPAPVFELDCASAQLELSAAADTHGGAYLVDCFNARLPRHPLVVEDASDMAVVIVEIPGGLSLIPRMVSIVDPISPERVFTGAAKPPTTWEEAQQGHAATLVILTSESYAAPLAPFDARTVHCHPAHVLHTEQLVPAAGKFDGSLAPAGHSIGTIARILLNAPSAEALRKTGKRAMRALGGVAGETVEEFRERIRRADAARERFKVGIIDSLLMAVAGGTVDTHELCAPHMLDLGHDAAAVADSTLSKNSSVIRAALYRAFKHKKKTPGAWDAWSQAIEGPLTPHAKACAQAYYDVVYGAVSAPTPETPGGGEQ